jgi:preprotein translocase subunit SecG
MRYGPGFYILRALAVVVVAGILLATAFGAGVAVGGGTSWAVGAHGGGHALFGLLVVLFVILLLFGLFGHARHYRGDEAWDGPGGWHSHSWRAEEWRQRREAAMNEWHRRAHGEGGPTGSTPGGSAGPTGPDATGQSR